MWPGLLAGALAVRSGHGGSALLSSQLPRLAPHSPWHRRAFTATQPTGAPVAPRGSWFALGNSHGPRPGSDSESPWCFLPRLRLEPGPRQSRALRIEDGSAHGGPRALGPFTLPAESSCHHAPAGGATHHCDPDAPQSEFNCAYNRQTEQRLSEPSRSQGASFLVQSKRRKTVCCGKHT